MEIHQVKLMIGDLEGDAILLSNLKRQLEFRSGNHRPLSMKIEGVDVKLTHDDDEAIITEAHARLVAAVEARIKETEARIAEWV